MENPAVSPLLPPQPALAGVQIEPDVPGVAATVGQDDPSGALDRATAFWGASLPRVRHGIREGGAVVVGGWAGDVLGPGHGLGHQVLGWQEPSPAGGCPPDVAHASRA